MRIARTSSGTSSGSGSSFALFAGEYSPRGWIAVMLASTAAIDLGFLAFEPQLDWYVGLSGVLHGLMAAGLVAWLVCRRDPLTVGVAALFVGKLAWEHLRGPLPFTAGTLTVPVVHEAHTYGAIGGALCALVLLARRARQRARAIIPRRASRLRDRAGHDTRHSSFPVRARNRSACSRRSPQRSRS